MTVARRLFAGAAVQTTLVSPISGTDLTISITGDTGWPTGAEEFFVVISPDQANEEKVLVTRSGTTLSAASTGERGVDGTAAASHPSGAVIYPCVSAADLDEANRAAARLTSGSTGQVAVSSADAAGFDWVAFELNDLDDVDSSAPSDTDLLTYDSGSGDWVDVSRSTLAGDAAFTGSFAAKQPTVGTSLGTTGTVDLDMAALNDTYQSITLTGNITFTTSNRAAGRSVTIRIVPGASSRTVTAPTSSVVLTQLSPFTFPANKTGVFSITFFGSNAGDGVVAFAVQQ